MIFCSWNIMGLNKPFKQKEFKNFLLKNKVYLVGCLETKVRQQNVTKVIRKFGADWCFYFDYSQAPNGRIWLEWKQSCVKETILDRTAQLVHGQVQDQNSQFQCKMSFVYGCNTIEGRRGSWEALRHISISIVEPWIVLGDFNTILFAKDRVNRMPVHLNETVDFQNCITDIGLGQVNRKGWLYSWCNKRDVADRIYNHIDWVFGNDKWFQS